MNGHIVCTEIFEGKKMVDNGVCLYPSYKVVTNYKDVMHSHFLILAEAWQYQQQPAEGDFILWCFVMVPCSWECEFSSEYRLNRSCITCLCQCVSLASKKNSMTWVRVLSPTRCPPSVPSYISFCTSSLFASSGTNCYNRVTKLPGFSHCQ